MRAEIANLNHCAVPFLSHAAVNLCWYDTNSDVLIFCSCSQKSSWSSITIVPTQVDESAA